MTQSCREDQAFEPAAAARAQHPTDADAGSNDDANPCDRAEVPADAQNSLDRNQPLDTDDIQAVLDAGLQVEDDNQPSPENVPRRTDPPPNNMNNMMKKMKNSTMNVSVCKRTGVRGVSDRNARLLDAKCNTGTHQHIDCFETMFFKQFIIDVIVPETNKRLDPKKGGPLTCGEFLCWIGIWLLIGTTNKSHDRHLFWRMSATG